MVLLAISCVLVAAAGVTVGAATGTSSSSSTAARLAAAGRYASAVAIDEAIAARGGPLYALTTGASGAAETAAEETVLGWAGALGRRGNVDEAVSLYRSVNDPSLRGQALEALATLLLKTATANALVAQYPSAIQRLAEISTLAPATRAGLQAARELPVDQAGEAGVLITSGRAADAVVLLDAVLKESSTLASATAISLLPTALLDAGEQALANGSYHEALTALDRLSTSFPRTPEAAQAAAMLGAPQIVSGTLVTHAGAAVSGRVRLSSNYKAEPGGMYQTSAPFYYATADAAGDFTFSSVPIGGPYVLEVFSAGNWTTLINPSTNQPANPVAVSALIPVNLTFVVLPS